jgi:hypothetical protein
MRPGPHPCLSSSLHAPDRHALASTDPQHSAAETTTRQHTPEAAVPGATSERCQDPRTGHLLVALPLASRDYKNPRRPLPEDAHPRRNRSPPFSLPLSLGNVPSLGACAAAFRETPATVGAAAGARWRSGAAAVDLQPRRHALLPLRRAPTIEHSSLHAPVSSRPGRGRRRVVAVRSRSIGRVPIRCVK